MENLEKGNAKIKRKLKFLLRRIENNIETENSKEEICDLFKFEQISLNDIILCTARDMIKKDEVLNSVAVKFYEEGLYDYVIPLFKEALIHNPKNLDVIYNLAYFLYQLGEKKLALTYFEKIQGISTETDEFIAKLRGEADE